MNVRNMAHHEERVAALCDAEVRALYAGEYDAYRPGLFPRVLGALLVFAGNVVYGREPSYLKFRAVEIIARVPYHSWNAAVYTLMTLCFANEQRALALASTSRFAHFAQENETMHVVVISQLAALHEKAGFIRGSFLPVLFAFFYFWWSYVLYIVHRRSSYELNFLFESHAYQQYSSFLTQNEDVLKARVMASDYLEWYGREAKTEYDFFVWVRNDELIHRNESIEAVVCKK